MPAKLRYSAPAFTSTPALPVLKFRHSASSGSRRPGARRAIGWVVALLVLLLSGLATTARAQTGPPSPECSEDKQFINTWYFGFKAGLDFSGAGGDNLPKPLVNSQMTAPAGAGIMSDGTGASLFYSNGDTIWNADGSVMATALGGSASTTDGPLAIKKPIDPNSPLPPGSPVRYLIFTQDAKGGAKGLSYSEIEIPAAGGNGTVITKSNQLAFGTTEKLTAAFHENSCDIWIIAHGWGNASSGFDNRGDSFLAYKVTKDGVEPMPILSTFPDAGSRHAISADPMGYRGQMKITPDGKQIAMARYSTTKGNGSSTVELFDFAPATGIVSNRKVIDDKEVGYYGVEFSPSRGKLYATVLGAAPQLPQLLQFDISVPTATPAPKKVIELKPAASPVNLGSLQAAPDGKIYVARQGAPALGIIVSPDSIDAKIPYDTLNLEGRRSGLGLVNFNQSTLLSAGFGTELIECRQVKFTASPPLPNPLSYAWTFKTAAGGVLGMSTEPNPVFTFPADGEYLVTLRIQYTCFCREVTIPVTIGPPPPGSIAKDQEICEGSAPKELTSTSPAGDGTEPITYQWQRLLPNGTWENIGVTSETFQPPILTATTSYRRAAFGFCKDVPSFTEPVKITVLKKVAPTVTITFPPDQCPGTPLTFTAVAASAGTAPTYEWFVNNTPVTASGNTFTSNTVANGDQVKVRVTASADISCPTGPAEATVTVTRTVAPTPTLTIAVQPTGPVCPADLLTFRIASVTGAGSTDTYQWQVDGTNAANGTEPVFARSDLRDGQIVTLRLTTTDACGQPVTVVSNSITVRVQPLVTPTVTLTSPPPQCPGTPLTFIATATNAGTAPIYQWFVNDVAVVADGANFTSNTVVTGDLVRVQVTATAGVCSTGPATATATVTRTVAPTPVLTIAVQPDSPVCPGDLLTFNIASQTGTNSPTTYQWQVDGTDAPTGNGPVFTSTTLRDGQVVLLRLRTTDICGQPITVFSNRIIVRVQPTVTPTVTLAAPPTLCPGTPLTFTAAVTNAGNAPTFRWFVNNIPVASGPTFTSSTVVTGDQVRVEVTASAGLCSTGPATATVTVTRTPTPAPTLTIAGQPSAPVCAGEPLTFSATAVANAGPNPVYQWLVDGNPVAGATTPVFTSATLRDGQTVTLRLNTVNTCAQALTAVSNGVVVRIQPPVKISAGPDKEIILGTSVVLEGTADGTYPVTWTPTTGLDFSGNEPLRPTASPKVTTTYRLSAGEGGCASFDEVTVTVRDAIRIPNAFTPNGDGRDDTWQIEFIEDFPNNTVTVFNRWGNQVFSAQNYSRANEWNGTINGKPAPVGTYYYVVVTKGPLGKSYSGSLTVLY